MDRLHHYWNIVRTSLWFVPLLMGAAAIAFAVTLLTVGTGLPTGKAEVWLLYTGSAENARGLLGSLLSGMITMTSLIISITMVVLTLAAGQLGPRLIRNFIGDRQTQTVLGLFLATILYLLVVFRTIDAETAENVPHLAVSVGTALSALCLFVLLFFVHKLARSIVYDNVVRDVASELDRTVDRLQTRPGDEQAEPDPPPEQPADIAWIRLGGNGYVQAVDLAAVVAAAERADAVVYLKVRPGRYVLARGEHVAVHPAGACTDDLAKTIRGAFILAGERTPTQDVEFGIRQLVEIALRALSPSMNDVFTAHAVIDNLSSSLAQIFERGPERRVLTDGHGAVRLVRDVPDDQDVIAAAFDQIRQSADGMASVLIRLADAIARLAPYIQRPVQCDSLLEQLALIEASGERSLDADRDIRILRDRCRAARDRLKAPKRLQRTENHRGTETQRGQ